MQVQENENVTQNDLPMSSEKLFSLFTNRTLIMFMSATRRFSIVMYRLLLLFLQYRIIQQMLLSQLQY
jgi:hypothetical protein